MNSTTDFVVATVTSRPFYWDNGSLDDASQNLTTTTEPAASMGALQTMRTVLGSIHIIICVTGLIGNGVILTTLLRTANTLSVTDMYILSLAISDFFFVLNLPLTAKEMLMGNSWGLGEGVCKLFVSLHYLTLCAGNLVVMAMSIDRFQNVVFAIKMMGVRTTKRARIIIAAIWTFAVIYMLPATFAASVGETQKGSNVNTCTLFYQNISSTLTAENVVAIHTVFRFVVAFLIPFVVMVFCNATIVHFIRKRRAKRAPAKGTLASVNNLKVQQHVKEQDRVTRLILLVTTVFLACFLPNLLLNTLWVLGPYSLNVIELKMNETLLVFRWWSVCLLYFNSALNPFLYAFSGSGFRQRIKEALLGRRYAREKYLKKTALQKSPQTVATRTHYDPSHATKENEALPLQQLTLLDGAEKDDPITSICCDKVGADEDRAFGSDGTPETEYERKQFELGTCSPERDGDCEVRDLLLTPANGTCSLQSAN